jgi:hypothetical protein
MRVTRSYRPLTECQHCGRPMPKTAATGRRRVYCSAACRKAAYEDRRAKRPGAVQVKIVDRVVVETRETVKVVDEGHGIAGCVAHVAASPRACVNILKHLADMARSEQLLDDQRWQPVLRALADLNQTVEGRPAHRRR